ncbi:putative ATP-dependent endonuclease of OLD family [Microbacterium sp. AG157]|uniref:ATP-binding protein n=1 Tax=Microbacterium sp. AG157 TaxID=2183993 RepID=UPI000E280E66|nr:ATP-binding protein [Microbacterium sp. AG157]REC97508.1 putative ATP-dependent endonuclease of OLD family [Microbacterium sp. AG157]
MSIRMLKFRNYRSFTDGTVELPVDQQFLALVGVNNSGKSSLLRTLYELRAPLSALTGMFTGSSELNKLLRGYPLEHARVRLEPGEHLTPDGLGDAVNPEVTIVFDRERSASSELIRELTFEIQGTQVALARIAIGHGREVTCRPGLNVQSYSGGMTGNLIHIDDQSSSIEVDWNEIHNDIRWLVGNFYVGPFRNAINTAGNSYYDLQIGKDFIATFNQYLNGDDYRQNKAMRKLIAELADIFGYERLEVSPSPDGTHLVFTTDGSSFRASESGAGISQFVIVAASVLMNRPNILLIDEPELNLHASLQLRFLTLLARYVSGPVLFATHSLGLARSAADQILVATRNPRGSSILKDYQASRDLVQTLGELGYGEYRDEAYKAVLLVEGVTDVRAAMELLSKYGVRNEVAIVALGGDDMAIGGRDVELSQLAKLSPFVFAVVDSEAKTSDAGPSSRRSNFATSCSAAGIECLVLGRRSIENYLNHEATNAVMKISGAESLSAFAAPPAGWSKSSNWRAARAIPKDHFDGTDIGAFLTKIAAVVTSTENSR